MIKMCSNFAEYTPLLFISGSGVSDSAIILNEKNIEIREYLANTVTFGERISKIPNELAEVGKTHSQDNWDGEGAKAVNLASYDNAFRFALAFPGSLQIPEIYVDPDGIITFEWYGDKRRVFSVSFGANGELSYAGLFGLNRTCGTEYLTDYMPEVIIDNISRVYSGVLTIGIK